MGVVQSTSDNDKEWYGTNQYQQVEEVSLVPLQLVGLVPCEQESTDCRDVPCNEIPAFDGDFNSFLFKFATDDNSGDLTDDYRLEEWNGTAWVEVVTGNTNNTLGSESGDKFTFGSFVEYPLYSGYKIDWTKCFNLYGAGVYRFKVFNRFDTDAHLYSQPFKLAQFTCDSAHGTFKINVTNQGDYRNFEYTKNGDTLQKFDLINMTWEDESRYEGRLLDQPIESEETFVKYGNYENRLNSTDDFSNFTLIIFKTTLERYKRLNLYGMRGKDINVTDSNIDSAFNYTEFDIISTSETSFEKYVNNRLIYNVEIGIQGGFDLGFRQC